MESIDTIFAEIQERMPAVAAWSYIAIWAFSEMKQRMTADPENPKFIEIKFPHTSVPLFTEDEATRLEDVFRKSTFATADSTADVGAPVQQSGGRMSFPPTIPQLKKGSKQLGQIIGQAVAGVDPEAFSIDSHFNNVTTTLDSIQNELRDLSKSYGLVALESVAPDPRFVIPIGPVPIPVTIPARSVLPVVNVLLESLRIMGIFMPIGGGLVTGPTTFLLVILDLARGNFYNAMYSFLGFFGSGYIFAGIFLKTLNNVYELISPDIRVELRSAAYKSSKSLITGTAIWIFSVLAPDMIRKPLNMLMDKAVAMADTINQTLDTAEKRAQSSLGRLATIKLPRLPSEKIPDISDLYNLQEFIHAPEFYCHPEISPLIQELRGIPPLALFFDIFLIPAPGSAEYIEKCAATPTLDIASFFKPEIIVNNPLAPTPVAQ
jgi:hypothetical protein